MKTFIKTAFILSLASFFISSAILSTNTYADNAALFEGRADHCNEFLGLTSWDCHVVISDQQSLKDGIWIIASNIAIDISVVASYLIIGYVIYGGYLYTLSGGDPSKVAAGKKTITNGFAGLAIVMSANIIMGAIRVALVGSSGNIGKCISGQCTTPEEMVGNIIGWVTAIVGLVSAVFLIYGGIQYMTSSGDPTKVKRAKNTILYSIIGLGIVALATIITAFVSNAIREANNTSYYQTIISKEVYDH